jgi:ABC-type enterochelin transport system substrate-binding protein
LTNKANNVKFFSDNGYAKLATVINNTLIQVVSIIGPFSGDTITLSGIFDEQTAADLKKQIDEEIEQNKKLTK